MDTPTSPHDAASIDNPFRPPAAPLAEYGTDTPGPLVLAGRGRRFLTCVVDYAAFLACSFVVGVVLVLLFGPGSVKFLDNRAAEWLFSVVLYLAYYFAFEATLGRTPGKFVTGTKVVDERGGPATVGQVFMRCMARLIPFEGLSFFGQVGVHDRLPGTRVVLVR